MKKDKIKTIIKKLLLELGEEDVGVSLFSTIYQNESELAFYDREKRKRVKEILHKLSDDSQRHKKILDMIIKHLEDKCCEK